MSGTTKAAVKAPEAKAAKFASQKRQPEIFASPTSIHEQIVVLQRTLGNQATQKLFQSGVIQAKLKIGQPNDIYEQEADRVADQVMRMPEPVVHLNPT